MHDRRTSRSSRGGEGGFYLRPKQPAVGGGGGRRQLEAVQRALVDTVTLWKGPPGTGKTHTLAAFIRLCVKVSVECIRRNQTTRRRVSYRARKRLWGELDKGTRRWLRNLLCTCRRTRGSRFW